MARRRRMLWEAKKIWSAGEYTLLADTHTADDGVTYAKGDTLVLNEREATKLGYMGVIGPPDGMHAVKARVEGGWGTARDEYLYQMWELSGAPSRLAHILPAAFAQQPDVLLRDGATLPHRGKVVEPHPLPAPALDTLAVVPPPDVHPDPCRGQRAPCAPDQAPIL